MARPAVRSSWFPTGRPGLYAFFTEQIWAVRVRDLPRARRVGYRTARVVYSTWCGIFQNRLTLRSAALTYYTVLSLVPFLAFAFSVVKGLGAYHAFIEGTIRPYVHATFEGSPVMVDAVDRILEFVNHTDVTTLGTVGLLTLVYASVGLLGSVEGALNDIWGAPDTRPIVRQVTNYVALIVTAPLLVVVATSYATAAQSSKMFSILRDAPVVGPALTFLPNVMACVTFGIAMFAVYAILPNVRVRLRSAVLGAVVSAILWQVALTLHVRFQVGVAGYNALYSALGAIPIFLVWTYFSWLIVLLGAEVAASHQNERLARQKFHADRIDPALRETLAILTVAEITHDFLTGRPPRHVATIAESLEAPPGVLEEICGMLARAGLLVEAATEGRRAFVIGRDIDAVRISDVRDALRFDPAAATSRADIEHRASTRLLEPLTRAEEERRASSFNWTLRQLGEAASVPRDESRPDSPGRRSGFS